MECVALEEVRRACGGLSMLQVNVVVEYLAYHLRDEPSDPICQEKEEKVVKKEEKLKTRGRIVHWGSWSSC